MGRDFAQVERRSVNLEPHDFLRTSWGKHGDGITFPYFEKRAIFPYSRTTAKPCDESTARLLRVKFASS